MEEAVSHSEHKLLFRMPKLSSPLGRYYVVLLLRKVKSVINLKLYSKAVATQALVETLPRRLRQWTETAFSPANGPFRSANPEASEPPAAAAAGRPSLLRARREQPPSSEEPRALRNTSPRGRRAPAGTLQAGRAAGPSCSGAEPSAARCRPHTPSGRRSCLRRTGGSAGGQDRTGQAGPGQHPGQTSSRARPAPGSARTAARPQGA